MGDMLSILPVLAGPRAWALLGDMSGANPLCRLLLDWVMTVTKGNMLYWVTKFDPFSQVKVTMLNPEDSARSL